MVEIFILLLGSIVGVVLGLTGAGGSVIAVPLLMLGLGWTLPQAVPVALLAVALSALSGMFTVTRRNLVCYRAAILMAALGLASAPAGIWLAQWLPHMWLLILFAIVLVAVAIRMYLQATYSPADSSIVRAAIDWQDSNPVCRFHPDTGKLAWSSPCAVVLALGGAVTGLMSGLIGVGGGFIIVPALRHLTQLSMHAAVGTSLMVIALISTAGFAGAMLQGIPVAWSVAVPFVGGAILGMAGGRSLAPFLAGPLLQKAFALLMILASAGLVGGLFH
ncbi:MAG: sulfite exporter TauE/SafE family protein [Gammaproteobacteria bacterium]|nr:sulfite exporter TauE/SafE family protein [Gammaproteobacteria bacterium]